jgi:hypothetical protein
MQISLRENEIRQMTRNADLHLQKAAEACKQRSKQKEILEKCQNLSNTQPDYFPQSLVHLWNELVPCHFPDVKRSRGSINGEGLQNNYDDFLMLNEQYSPAPLEVGRADDLVQSTPIMPWHASAAGSSLSSSQKAKSDSGNIPLFEDFNQSDRGSLASEFSFHPPSFSDVEIHDIPGELPDKESSSFLTYTKSLMQQSGSKGIFLFDIIREGDRKTASAAFYNVLVLCNIGALKVNQNHPYDDIAMMPV